MNSEIKNLEQQLIDLKVKEKWEQLQNDLSKTKEKYLNKYYMELEGFKENSYLINDDKGIEEFGSSAYFVNTKWLNNE